MNTTKTLWNYFGRERIHLDNSDASVNLLYSYFSVTIEQPAATVAYGCLDWQTIPKQKKHHTSSRLYPERTIWNKVDETVTTGDDGETNNYVDFLKYVPHFRDFDDIKSGFFSPNEDVAVTTVQFSPAGVDGVPSYRSRRSITEEVTPSERFSQWKTKRHFSKLKKHLNRL